jgi:hypothetical protein
MELLGKKNNTVGNHAKSLELVCFETKKKKNNKIVLENVPKMQCC